MKKKMGSLSVLLTLVLALLLPGVAQAKAPQLTGETSHTPGAQFDYPYLLAWEGEISGVMTGWIEWWIDVETWTAWPYILAGELPPNASQYTMIVRIYDSQGGSLLLETLEHGTTTLANTTWRANGVVVDAPGFPGWEGRRVHERGVFTMGATGPVEGTSDFRIS